MKRLKYVSCFAVSSSASRVFGFPDLSVTARDVALHLHKKIKNMFHAFAASSSAMWAQLVAELQERQRRDSDAAKRNTELADECDEDIAKLKQRLQSLNNEIIAVDKSIVETDEMNEKVSEELGEKSEELLARFSCAAELSSIDEVTTGLAEPP
jgi:septal ring factor EnvC (AmiA/AmiB activator)